MQLKKSSISLAAALLCGSVAFSAQAQTTHSISAPTAGATLSGSVNACEYTGASTTSYVRFYVDGVWLNTDTAAPFRCNIDTSRLTNGTHTLRAMAYTSAAVLTTRELTFVKGTATTPTPSPTPTPTPTPTTGTSHIFSLPTAGQTLSGATNVCDYIGASNTDFVRFYVDGAWIATDGAAPWRCNIDTSRLTNGTHTLRAMAHTATGAVTTRELSFVKGTTPTPTPTTGNTPPALTFRALVNGGQITAPVSASSGCEVLATDDKGVRQVQFFLDAVSSGQVAAISAPLNTDAAAPWQCAIDPARFAAGAYNLRAVATDTEGAIGTSQVAVSLGTTPTPTPTPTPTTGGPIAAADIRGHAQGEVPFAQQSGYNTQILAQYLDAPQIPETGMHASVLPTGETLRFGKHADPRNSTRKVLAFQVDPSDVTTSGAKRAELKFANNIEMDQIYWAALSVYVNEWGQLGASDTALFGLQQHNGSPADLSPNFAIYTSNGGRNFQIHARGSSSSTPGYGNSVTMRYADQPIPFGRWIDFVFKFKLNTSGDGMLQVWMDGTQIVDHRGLLGYITPGYKDFCKFGYYNWSGSSFASARKVLMRSPVVVSDPTGTKYRPEDLRAYINAH